MAQCGFTATSAYYLNNMPHVHIAHAWVHATWSNICKICRVESTYRVWERNDL